MLSHRYSLAVKQPFPPHEWVVFMRWKTAVLWQLVGESGAGSACCLVRHTIVSRTFLTLMVPGWLHYYWHLLDILNTPKHGSLPCVRPTGVKNIISITFFKIFSTQSERSTIKRTNLLLVHMVSFWYYSIIETWVTGRLPQHLCLGVLNEWMGWDGSSISHVGLVHQAGEPHSWRESGVG